MFFLKLSVTVLRQTNHSIICKRLVSNKVRVRFAPSPTGFLHLGGLRTALYNHLFAKSKNGVTILRIEDTDVTRKIPLAAENLVEDLAWCGITFDEGPFFQSERVELYQKYAKQLIDQGDAYYCFCTSVRLDLIRREALKLGEIPKYDNCCRHLSKEEVEKNLEDGKTCCVRFKLTNFSNTFEDLIHGSKSHDVAAVEGDPIILKTDGYPTYHLANVVDDHLMNITHVLRGIEWLTSTPKHILLYRAFKWDIPQFGHIPLLLNQDGTKVSKRQSDIHVGHFRETGYFPNSLINFVIRFGGGFDIKTEKELRIYTMDELVDMFDITKVRVNSGKTDLTLLPAYNQAEIVRLLETEQGTQDLVKKTQEVVRNHFKNSKHENNLQLDDRRVEFLLKSMKNRITSVGDLLTEHFYYLWAWENKWSETNETYREIVRDLLQGIKTVNWTQEDLNKFIKKFCKGYSGVKYADIMKALRLILTGNEVGHGVGEIMACLSKEDVQFRLSKALESKKSQATS